MKESLIKKLRRIFRERAGPFRPGKIIQSRPTTKQDRVKTKENLRKGIEE